MHIADVLPPSKAYTSDIFPPTTIAMVEKRMEERDAATKLTNRSVFRNGASIFTRSGKVAREFKQRVKTGMVGINIGVPASMAWFPFNGWDDFFFGDLHMQGKEGVQYGEGNIWAEK